MSHDFQVPYGIDAYCETQYNAVLDNVCSENGHALFARPFPLWKRAMDFGGAVTGLICFAPIMIAVAENNPTSANMVAPIGQPSLATSRKAGQSGRQIRRKSV